MEDEGSSIGELDPSTSFGSRGRRGGGGGIEEEEESVSVDDDSSNRGRLLLGVANVGGSLTVLLQIALVAWGVRQLRSMLARRRQRAEAARRDASRVVDQVPFSMLSPVAVKRLLEFDPVRRFFVDVRFPAAVNEHPAPFEAVLHIPELEVDATLQLPEADWEDRFPSDSKIGKSDLIVFLSTKGCRAQRAAKVAADLGYSGCCVLSGGIEAYESAMSNYVDVPLKFLSRSQVPGIQNPTVSDLAIFCRGGIGTTWNGHHAPRYSMDAVATLLEKRQNDGDVTESGSSSIHLLDVRRHDERALFGHIKGSQNIPVVELPKALTLDKVAWEEAYHFPKFSEDDMVIFQCRVHGRAAWAAQLAKDAGLKKCFVYKDGVFGWRLDPTVLPHDAYKLGDTPPDRINFEVEKVDHEAAREELERLGLG